MVFKVFTPRSTVSFFDNSEAKYFRNVGKKLYDPVWQLRLLLLGIQEGTKNMNFTMNIKIRLSSISVNTANILHYSSYSEWHIHIFRKDGASTPNLRSWSFEILLVSVLLPLKGE